MGRRRNNDFEALIAPIAILLFLFGAAVLAFLKALALIALLFAGLALIGFLTFRLVRNFWERQLDIGAYLPRIDWTLPHTPAFSLTWINTQYPDFPPVHHVHPPNIIGTSGAWKDVLSKSQRLPALRGASAPAELQRRVEACEAAAPTIAARALADASKLARQKTPALEQQIRDLQAVEQDLSAQVRPKLDLLRDTIEAMQSSTFFDRLRARRLATRLSSYGTQLDNLCREAHDNANRQGEVVRRFLDPVLREQMVRERIRQDLGSMKAILASKEFAGAVAEMEVIAELSRLSPESLIFNDVRMESGRCIRFDGKPLMSAQIDTLAITRNGVFVIEVKNWSREFADSGEGFSPYEQARRASYLVYDRLHRAGIATRVPAIIATNGSLPHKGDQKVTVVPIRRLRTYIERAPPSQVDISSVRSALRL